MGGGLGQVMSCSMQLYSGDKRFEEVFLLAAVNLRDVGRLVRTNPWLAGPYYTVSLVRLRSESVPAEPLHCALPRVPREPSFNSKKRLGNSKYVGSFWVYTVNFDQKGIALNWSTADANDHAIRPDTVHNRKQLPLSQIPKSEFANFLYGGTF
jgi:hypothetical protein